MIVRRAILPLGILALLSCQLVAASDDDDGGLDHLNNGQGQTPCEMADSIKECGASRRARGLVSRSLYGQRATESSNCTCTNVYFNLYTACLVMDNKGPPTADRWTSQCEDDGFHITSARFDGYDIPSWAYADMPAGNATFNVNQALSGQCPLR
ncbi:hypothetical protein BDZ89DRAFT_760912 [Hymenopellis radicata]|nr:hypothetical protein BDZ89DRAFT_760912 [Hymenopellis radicata]